MDGDGLRRPRRALDHLHLEPLLPADWGSFSVDYRYRQTTYHIEVRGPTGGGRGIERLVCDGVEQPGQSIPLRDDRVDHRAEVWLDGIDTPGR